MPKEPTRHSDRILMRGLSSSLGPEPGTLGAPTSLPQGRRPAVSDVVPPLNRVVASWDFDGTNPYLYSDQWTSGTLMLSSTIIGSGSTISLTPGSGSGSALSVAGASVYARAITTTYHQLVETFTRPGFTLAFSMRNDSNSGYIGTLTTPVIVGVINGNYGIGIGAAGSTGSFYVVYPTVAGGIYTYAVVNPWTDPTLGFPSHQWVDIRVIWDNQLLTVYRNFQRTPVYKIDLTGLGGVGRAPYGSTGANVWLGNSASGIMSCSFDNVKIINFPDYLD